MTFGLTDVLAWIGALTGVAALVWQIATWRRSAHRVKVVVGNSFFTYPDGSVGDHLISVTAINRGAAPVTVTGWGIRMGDTKENANQLVAIPHATALPHRLENGADANFFMVAEAMRQAHRDRHLSYSKMRPWVRLATGQQIFANRGLPLRD